MAKEIHKKTGEEFDSPWRRKSLRSDMFKKNGKRKSIEDAPKFWALACEYFAEVDENPIYRNELLKSGDLAGTQAQVTLARPYSWRGFEAFLVLRGIVSKLDDYRYNTLGRYDDYIEVVQAVGSVMHAQKFEGASVGLFNANIIMSDLKMAEIVHTHLSGNVSNEPEYDKLSDETLEDIARNTPKQ
jgi:hypothetical protein